MGRGAHHGCQVDPRVRLVERDEQRRLVRVLARLSLALGRIVRHVQLDLAEVRLEEHREPVDAHDRNALLVGVCMRVGLRGGVRVCVRVRVRSHCG